MRPDLNVAPPRKGRIQRIVTSTTAATTALAAGVVGMGWVRVKARGSAVQFYFTTNPADAVVVDAATGDTCGWTLLAGSSEDYYLASETHIAWDAEGAGFLEIVRAGQERTGQR